MSLLARRISDITTDDILSFALIFMCVGVTCLFIMLAWKKKNDRETRYMPVEGMEASIVDKQQLSPNTYAFEVWVLFEGDDGRRIRLMCKSNNDYVIGDKGYVKWQGTKLFSFERGKKAPSSIMRDFSE